MTQDTSPAAGNEGEPRRAATAEAMLDAAEDLFSREGFEAVTVRDIAHRAGVSHALVHRYLGSKADVFRAVVQRNENVIRAAAGDTEDLGEAVHLMLHQGLKGHVAYLRIIAHSAMHGMPFSSTMGRFPATERLVEIAQKRAGRALSVEEDQRVRLRIAQMVALFLGWASAADWILQAAGVDQFDEDRLAEELEGVIVRTLERELPSAGS